MNRDDSGHLHFKIVVWGPFASGKTTVVKWYYNHDGQLNKGGFTSVENNRGETVYFDYASLSTGGEVVYDFFAVGGSPSCTKERKTVAEGTDAIIFVADSQRDKMKDNLESLEEVSNVMGDAYPSLPKIFLLNKRDLGEDLISSDEFSELPNVRGFKVFESTATTGAGIEQAFQYLMLDLVQETITLQEIPQAPPELARMGVALLSAAEGFEPSIEATYPQAFSIAPSQAKIVTSLHPQTEASPSFATVKTDNLYLCSYHTAQRDSLGASYILTLALPLDTPPKRIVSLFRRIQDSAPVILGQINVTSPDALKLATEQLYIVARDHISSTTKGSVQSLVPNPREFLKSKLFAGGAAEAISEGVAYLSLSQQKNQFELLYAPSRSKATYTTVTPLDEYGLKTMIKEVDRLRINFETRVKSAVSQEARKKSILGFLDEMKKVGGSILTTMFSKGTLSKIADDNPKYLTFEVDRDRLAVPLEMLHDGEDFLCLRRGLSRWIIEEHGSINDEKKEKLHPRTRSGNEPITILIVDSRVEGQVASIPGSFEEQLEQFLKEDKALESQNVKVESLRGGLKKDDVAAHLSSGNYDIVHLISPAEVSSGDPTASSWIFQDGEIRGHELEKLFINGYPQLIVSYVSSPSWERKWDGKQQDKILFTLAYSIKSAGTDCIVGAVTDGLTESMLTLTKSLYLEILKNKKPVGEALKEARLQLIKANGREDENWMKPVLYGNPAKTVY
jgi:signal recognition particle receptor subunit beta/CHAT domain-containing protein